MVILLKSILSPGHPMANKLPQAGTMVSCWCGRLQRDALFLLTQDILARSMLSSGNHHYPHFQGKTRVLLLVVSMPLYRSGSLPWVQVLVAKLRILLSSTKWSYRARF